MTSVRPKLGKTFVTAELLPWRSTFGATLLRAMTSRQPVIWKLLSTRMGASKAATQRCVRLTKSPKTWPSTRWVAFSLWTTSYTLRVERSSLGGPTVSDPERSFQCHYWRGPTNFQVHQAFSSPDILTGVFRAPPITREQQPEEPPMEPTAAEGIQREEGESVIFGCPEEGCIKVYQSHSSLQRPWCRETPFGVGERVHVRRDKKKWAETCKSISGSYMEATHPSTSGSASVSLSQSEDTLPTADMGWALKKTKKHVHFTTKARQFLREVFLQGEETGNKATVEDVAARMRSMRTTEGTKVFTKDEWLTFTQISRYFSRLAALNRSGVLYRTEEVRPTPTKPVPEGGESEDEEEDPCVAEAPIIRRRLQIRRELEL